MKHKIIISLFWLFFILIDCVVAGGISEAWVRLFIPVKNVCYYHDHTLGDMYCPNQETYGYVEDGYSNILFTNSYGFHDYERIKEGEPGVYRIQVYGDSLIGGLGVPMDFTIPSLLEKFLNEENYSNKFEVLNMSSAEDSTSSQLLTFQEIGKHFDADLIICYFMSDFGDNIIETHKRTRSPYHKINTDGELELIPPVPVDLSTFKERFKRDSLLYRLMANKVLESKTFNDLSDSIDDIINFVNFNSNSINTTGKQIDAKTQRTSIMINKSWPLTLRLIEKFNNEVEAYGAKFVLVDGRAFLDSNVRSVYTNEDFKEILAKKNISYLSVYEKYEELKSLKNKKDYFFLDGHPKKLGNAELSRVLADKIKRLLIAKRYM